MVGSLNKVWPWKETLETYTDSHGVVRPLVEANVSTALFSGTDAIRSALSGSDRDVYRGFCAYLWHRVHRKKMQKQQ